MDQKFFWNFFWNFFFVLNQPKKRFKAKKIFKKIQKKFMIQIFFLFQIIIFQISLFFFAKAARHLVRHFVRRQWAATAACWLYVRTWRFDVIETGFILLYLISFSSNVYVLKKSFYCRNTPGYI